MITMKAKFSTAWKGSTQPRKQRKYRVNAPLHTRGSFLNASLIKDLRAKHGARTTRVRVGDKVRVQRGQFAGREGKVERISIKDSTLIINKVELIKKDGVTKVPYPVNASNVAIVELDLTDKRRAASLKKEK
jgi:large subunit ribosomal protein L24